MKTKELTGLNRDKIEILSTVNQVMWQNVEKFKWYEYFLKALTKST